MAYIRSHVLPLIELPFPQLITTTFPTYTQPILQHYSKCLTENSAGSLDGLHKHKGLVLTSSSKEAFESAIQEQGKYVLILAYNGTVHPKAEE
jgi:hypothetical protein